MTEGMIFTLCTLLAFSLVDVVASSETAVKNNSSTLSTSVTHKPNTSMAVNVTMSSLSLDGSMIQRALYVLIGITLIGVLYFLVRAVRLKKVTAPRKKYGLLTNYDDSVEMAHLESDEEEDTTLYEARALRR